ncbi:MAG: TIGR02808 family protein [Vibrio sp.]
MSTLEYVIWHILGYAAMPAIILGGFVAVAVICIWILSLTKDKQID